MDVRSGSLRGDFLPNATRANLRDESVMLLLLETHGRPDVVVLLLEPSTLARQQLNARYSVRVRFTFLFNHISHFLFDNATTLSLTRFVQETP
jgi:hypothetical protein